MKSRWLSLFVLFFLIGCDEVVEVKKGETKRTTQVVSCEKVGVCYQCGFNYKGKYVCGWGLHLDCPGHQNAIVDVVPTVTTWKSGNVVASQEVYEVQALEACR